MPDTPKRRARPGSASTSTLAIFSLPSYSSASWSSTGATMRHGPHQAAQKSTRTGTSLCSTSVVKGASLTSIAWDTLLLSRRCCAPVYACFHSVGTLRLSRYSRREPAQPCGRWLDVRQVVVGRLVDGHLARRAVPAGLELAATG